jgi:hypothetical protein
VINSAIACSLLGEIAGLGIVVIWNEIRLRFEIRAGAPEPRTFPTNVADGAKALMSRSRPPTVASLVSVPRSSMSLGVIKRVFGFQKVCYQLAKNPHRLEATSSAGESVLVAQEVAIGVGNMSAKSSRTRDREAQREDVSAETCHCADRERNSTAISVLRISFSDVS